MDNLKYMQLDFLLLYNYGIKNNLIKEKFKVPAKFKTYSAQIGTIIRLLYHQLLNLENDWFCFEYQIPKVQYDPYKFLSGTLQYTGWVGVIFDPEIEELLDEYKSYLKKSKVKKLKFHKDILKLQTIIDSDKYDTVDINYYENISLFKELRKYIKFAKRLKKLSKVLPKLKTFLKEEKAKKKKNVKHKA